MSAGAILLWIILPYFAMATFIVGHWWRYRTDQLGWTSGSTQLLERKILGWASPAFHYGALAAIGERVVGLLIPKSLTDTVGRRTATLGAGPDWAARLSNTTRSLSALADA